MASRAARSLNQTLFFDRGETEDCQFVSRRWTSTPAGWRAKPASACPKCKMTAEPWKFLSLSGLWLHDESAGLAAEVATYRSTYNIADSDPVLLPKSHVKNSEVAQDLSNRAAELHKHSALTTLEPMPAEAKEQVAQQKNEQSVTTLTPTSAEAKLAELRRLVQGSRPTTAEKENSVTADPEQEMGGKKPVPVAESLLEKLRRNRTELQNVQKSHAQDEELRRKRPNGPSLT